MALKLLLLLPFLAAPAVAGELCGPPAPPDPAVWNKHIDLAGVGRAHRWAWASCAATAADLGLTEVALARGWEESDPLIRNRGVRLGSGVVTCGVQHFLAANHPKVSRVVSKIGIAARVIAIGINVKRMASR